MISFILDFNDSLKRLQSWHFFFFTFGISPRKEDQGMSQAVLAAVIIRSSSGHHPEWYPGFIFLLPFWWISMECATTLVYLKEWTTMYIYIKWPGHYLLKHISNSKNALIKHNISLLCWLSTISIKPVLWLLMAWCTSTRASAAAKLINIWLWLHIFQSLKD